jgi:hypothetical protein
MREYVHRTREAFYGLADSALRWYPSASQRADPIF